MCHKIIYLVFTSFISLLMTHCCLLKHTPFNLSVKKLKYPAIICIVYAVQVQMHTGDYSNYTCTCMQASTHACRRMRTHTHTYTHSCKQSSLNMCATRSRIPLCHLDSKQAWRVRNSGSPYKLLTISMLIGTTFLACLA